MRNCKKLADNIIYRKSFWSTLSFSLYPKSRLSFPTQSKFAFTGVRGGCTPKIWGNGVLRPDYIGKDLYIQCWTQ